MPPWLAGIFTTSPGWALTRSPPLYGACRPRPFGSPPSELVYSIVARPEFKSLKDLRGKRIAVTGLGGTSEVVLRIGLEAAGENPKDFIIIGLGAAQLMSGLESGSIEAANFNPPFLYFAKRKGFRELLDVGAHAQMPLGGLTASNASIQNRAGRVEADDPFYANRPADASSGERKECRFHCAGDQSGPADGGRQL